MQDKDGDRDDDEGDEDVEGVGGEFHLVVSFEVGTVAEGTGVEPEVGVLVVVVFVELEEVAAEADVVGEVGHQWSIPPCLGPFLMAMRFAWT